MLAFGRVIAALLLPFLLVDAFFFGSGAMI